MTGTVGRNGLFESPAPYLFGGAQTMVAQTVVMGIMFYNLTIGGVRVCMCWFPLSSCPCSSGVLRSELAGCFAVTRSQPDCAGKTGTMLPALRETARWQVCLELSLACFVMFYVFV